MSAATTEPPRALPLPGDYHPAPGAYDELVAAEGVPRAHWQPLLPSLARLSQEDFAARLESIRRILREHGATYNVYADAQGQSRPWSLDLLPLLIPPEEWRQIERGLMQRSRLLNLILADIYGPQRLLDEGLLPPALLFANPGFLRQGRGLRPPGEVWLCLHGIDLARSPDGKWWVLADRAQAPSGAGYALENRLVLSRIFPDEFRDCHAQRLASFFQTTRDTLRRLAPTHPEHPNVVLLTPGPYNETYFEQAFLARYLGFPLVEGSDLTVRNRRVFVKTLEGLQPVDVIFRRLDDAFCDPLELRPESSLGAPGLLEAARAGNVALANAFGSGVVEMPALMAFLPSLCRRLLGEDLLLPSVATWWCGQEPAFEHVRERLPELVVKPAFTHAGGEPAFGPQLDASARSALLASIESARYNFVAQEQVNLSSVPVWNDGRLEPRPMVMRAFVCATADGYAVMPGALTRFSASSDRLMVSMQSGGGSKDTWVIADGPVSTLSLLKPQAQVIRLERVAAEVPSRVADNLFWFGRYAERLEDTVRLLRCLLVRLVAEGGNEETPELAALIGLMVNLDLFPAKLRESRRLAGVEREVYRLLYQAHRLGTIRDLASRLRNLAFVLRDRFSADTWNILNKVQADARLKLEHAQAADALAMLNALVMDLAALSGLEMENLTRGHGWRFLEIGRRLERAMNVVTLILATAALPEDNSPVLEPVLEIADSVMTYRRRYFAQPQWASALDLLLADDSNPRSLVFQVNALADHAVNLPREAAPDGPAHPARQIAAIRDLLLRADWQVVGEARPPGADTELTALLGRCAAGLRGMSDAITHLYFSHAETRVS